MTIAFTGRLALTNSDCNAHAFHYVRDSLFHFDVGRLDALRPACHVVLHESAELERSRAGTRFETRAEKSVLRVGLRDCLGDFAVQPFYDGLRRASRH